MHIGQQITRVVWTLSSLTCRSSSSEHAIGSTCIMDHYGIIAQPIRQWDNLDTGPYTIYTCMEYLGNVLTQTLRARSGNTATTHGHTGSTSIELRKYDNDAPSPVECDVELGDLQPEPGRIFLKCEGFAWIVLLFFKFGHGAFAMRPSMSFPLSLSVRCIFPSPFALKLMIEYGQPSFIIHYYHWLFAMINATD